MKNLKLTQIPPNLSSLQLNNDIGALTLAYETCFDAYAEARLARKSYPLTSGEYKLHECRDRLGSTLQELGRIQNLVSGHGNKWSLMHCTSEDKHLWLKGVLTDVAWRLGYEVIPGLRALTGDEVPKASINAVCPDVRLRVAGLMPRLELTRQLIAKDIEYEYRRMRSGDSMLKPLVTEAIQITEIALSVID